MKKRLLSILACLALCLGLLPTAALAADDWKHTSHDDNWTALTEDLLEASYYTLMDGKYYLEEDIFTSEQLVINGVVTLCLDAKFYDYTGTDEAAILVKKGASLTVCCCQMDADYGIFPLGSLSNNNGKYGIWNQGTLIVADSNISGADGQAAIYNDKDASLTLSGMPFLNPYNSSRPYDICTYDAIFVKELGKNGMYSTIYIGYYGKPGVVVDGFTDESEVSYFSLTYPEGALTDYEDGKLICMAQSSLQYCGQPVQSQAYYKIENRLYDLGNGNTIPISTLISGTPEDYDLYWDEESKTLTFNSLETISNGFAFDTAMFLADCPTLTVELIGENKITTFSNAELSNKDVYAIYNSTGNVVIQTADGHEDSSLEIELGLSNSCDFDHMVAGIVSSGKVENHVNLSVTSQDSEYSAQNFAGIYCADFDNQGTFTANMTEEGSGITVIYCENSFSNTGNIALTANGNNVCGLNLNGAVSFENSKSIRMDLEAELSSQGIYCSTDQFFWNNETTGDIAIQVSGKGGSVGGVTTGPVAGMNLWTDTITLINSGSLSLTAVRKNASALTNITWPIGQSFDTIGLALNCRGGSVENSGVMTLTAQNGNSAGLDLISENKDVSIVSSGRLQASATTLGGDGIRAIGIYGEIKFIDDVQVKNLPLTLSGEADASAAAEEDVQVDPENLMAVCLVQSFDNGAPTSMDALQQISAGAGYLLPGTPVVLKQGDQDVYFNTIAGTDGQPTASMHLLKELTGTVSIGGSALVDSTLTAQITGLPSDATVSYQWQVSDSADGPFTNLMGETGTTLFLTNEHVGKYIRLVVTPTDGIYGGKLTAVTYSWVSYPQLLRSILLH